MFIWDNFMKYISHISLTDNFEKYKLLLLWAYFCQHNIISVHEENIFEAVDILSTFLHFIKPFPTTNFKSPGFFYILTSL